MIATFFYVFLWMIATLAINRKSLKITLLQLRHPRTATQTGLRRSLVTRWTDYLRRWQVRLTGCASREGTFLQFKFPRYLLSTDVTVAFHQHARNKSRYLRSLKDRASVGTFHILGTKSLCQEWGGEDPILGLLPSKEHLTNHSKGFWENNYATFEGSLNCINIIQGHHSFFFFFLSIHNLT
jgi:hypothetical protein